MHFMLPFSNMHVCIIMNTHTTNKSLYKQYILLSMKSCDTYIDICSTYPIPSHRLLIYLFFSLFSMCECLTKNWFHNPGMGHRVQFEEHCSVIYYQEVRILVILDFT